MDEKNGFGKMIVATLLVMTAVLTVFAVLYRLTCNLLSFLALYDEPRESEVPLLFDELDEGTADGEAVRQGLTQER